MLGAPRRLVLRKDRAGVPRWPVVGWPHRILWLPLVFGLRGPCACGVHT